MKNKLILSLFAPFVLSVTVILVSLVAFLQTNRYLNLESKKLQNQAVTECFAVAQVETKKFVDDEQKDILIKEPIREIYNYCLADKGFESTTAQ